MTAGARLQRTDETRRVFFRIERNGRLQSGVASGDITATVVNPGDTATSTPTVTESSAKPGVYYFDVPSAFLTAVGEYGVAIEVDSSGPNIRTTFTFPIHVSANDLDAVGLRIVEIHQLLGLEIGESVTRTLPTGDGAGNEGTIAVGTMTFNLERQSGGSTAILTRLT